jgi:hypothetical protein
MGLDVKVEWPTDHRLQLGFDSVRFEGADKFLPETAVIQS